MRAKILSAALLLLAACGSDAPTEFVASENNGGENVAANRLERMPAQMSGMTRQRRLVIRNQAELEAFWAELSHPNSFGAVPEVDFDSEMLIAAAMGPRPSGGFRIAMESVTAAPGSRYHVVVRSVVPGPACPSIAVITSPVDVIRVPIARGVSFEEQTVTNECRG